MINSIRRRHRFGSIRERLLAGCLAASAVFAGQAQIDVSFTSCTPVDLPDFLLILVTVNSADGPITSLVGRFEGNAINQVNPQGLPTVFNDQNDQFGSAGAHPSQDSQFLFSANDLLIGESSESSSELTASFTYPGNVNFGHEVDLAQIVIPETSEFTYEIGVQVNGEFILSTGSSPLTLGGSATPDCIPEPSTAAMALIGMTWLTRRRRI